MLREFISALVLLAVASCFTQTPDAEWDKTMREGLAAQNAGRWNEAEAHFESARKLAKSFPKNDPRLASTLNNLGLIYLAQDRTKGAESLFEEALEILKKAFGNEHPNLAVVHMNMARMHEVCATSKSFLDVSAQRKPGQQMSLQSTPQNPPVPAASGAEEYRYWYRRFLRELQPVIEKNEYAAAEKWIQSALEIREKAYGPNHAEVARTLAQYAELLHKMKRDGEASKVESRAAAIRSKSGF